MKIKLLILGLTVLTLSCNQLTPEMNSEQNQENSLEGKIEELEFEIYHLRRDLLGQYLSGIVNTGSVLIDGDQLESLYKRYLNSENMQEIEHDSLYQKFNTLLLDIQAKNDFVYGSIHSIRYDKQLKIYQYGISSDRFSFQFGDTAKTRLPKSPIKNQEIGGYAPVFSHHNGHYTVSAFCSIENSKGEIVALLRAETNITSFKKVWKHYKKRLQN